MPGVPASRLWPTLPIHLKKKVVVQIAAHLASLFSLRFSLAGSLYFASDALSGADASVPTRSDFRVGPIVSAPFYRALDGIVEYPHTDLHQRGFSTHRAFHALRGPFAHASSLLTHGLRAELHLCTRFPAQTVAALDEDHMRYDTYAQQVELADKEAALAGLEFGGGAGEPDIWAVRAHSEAVFARALRAIPRAINLVKAFFGDEPVCALSTPDRPFTLWWDDLRLSNFMVRLPSSAL
jgi:hypothetical protein